MGWSWAPGLASVAGLVLCCAPSCTDMEVRTLGGSGSRHGPAQEAEDDVGERPWTEEGLGSACGSRRAGRIAGHSGAVGPLAMAVGRGAGVRGPIGDRTCGRAGA